MDTSTWVSVTREDGEPVGYLEPLDEEYATLQPRSLLGHAVGDPGDFLTGEVRLLDRGIGELAEHWRLTDPPLPNPLSILEVSPDGIVVADTLATKALIATDRIHVDWPDARGRLVRWRD